MIIVHETEQLNYEQHLNVSFVKMIMFSLF